jgi:hypothetical protein
VASLLLITKQQVVSWSTSSIRCVSSCSACCIVADELGPSRSTFMFFLFPLPLALTLSASTLLFVTALQSPYLFPLGLLWSLKMSLRWDWVTSIYAKNFREARGHVILEGKHVLFHVHMWYKNLLKLYLMTKHRESIKNLEKMTTVQ